MIATYTTSDYIDAIHNENITVQNLHFQEMIGEGAVKLLVNDLSVLRLYHKELVEESRYVTLSNTEKLKYFYKPWLYCYDVYGTTELWFELLDLNQLRSFTEFNHETFRVFNPNILSKLKSIMDLESEVIGINASEILRQKKEAAIS